MNAMYSAAHDESIAKASPFVLEEVVRLMIDTQREKLSAAIKAKEAKGTELDEEAMGVFSNLFRWKMWGLTLQRENIASELDAAKLLLAHLDATDETVSFIMDALGAEEGVVGDAISKDRFLEIAQADGEVEDEIIEALVQEVNAEVKK